MDILWFICCFAAGALFGSMFSEVGKDLYKKLKYTWAKFRSPNIQTKDRNGYYIYTRKKPRWWHK